MPTRKRPTDRRANELRPTTIRRADAAAPGAVVITQGRTTVLCTASIAQEVPRWLLNDKGVAERGWITAEYAMLPGSTPDRKRRGPDSRSTEIQRLIARSLRAAADLTKMPGLMITCDCDVVLADGGTRTASITGAFVALSQAVAAARAQGKIDKNPIRGPVAAISVGIVGGRAYLDLDYELDARADVDMNIVMDHRGRYVEVQGTGEQGTFSGDELNTLLSLAGKGIRSLQKTQREVLRKFTGKRAG